MGKRVLVVDDDPQLQRLLELALKRAGFEVYQATSGTEAVARVLDVKPDVILMDIMMPDISGFEATRQIRRLPEGRGIPVIFLSALGDVEAKVKAFRVGGTDYVTKPVNITELIERIKAHLVSEQLPMGRLLMIFGSKGGVGTTMFTVNLALALRGTFKDSNVLIVDWQRPIGDVATFLGMVEPTGIGRLLPVLSDLDREMVKEALIEWTRGVYVLAGLNEPSLAGQMTMEALGEVLELSLPLADFVLVDCGAYWQWPSFPWISKDTGANLCLITPELTSLRRTLYILQDAVGEESELYLVVNREGMSGGMAIKQIKEYLGHHILGGLPDIPDEAVRSMNRGKPLVLDAPRSSYVRALHDIAKRLGGTI